MLRLLVGQVRGRFNLLPGATKGWNPAQFGSVGQAMEFAIASKRMKFSWLAQATRIPVDRLKSAVRTGLQLTSDEISKVELYLGLPLRKEVLSRIQRTRP